MTNGTNKILCAGCSHTQEYHWRPWPSYLKNSVNIGIRGAGSDLISKRVTVELAENQYSHLIIQWPDPNRWDLFIEDDAHVLEALPISAMQQGQNRTLTNLKGSEVPIDGYCTPGSEHRGYMKTYYKQYFSPRQHQINFWNCVLTIQLLCEKLDIKYAWTTVLDLSEYGKCPFNFVDKTKFIQSTGMINYLETKGFGMNNIHFPTEAHEEWSKIIKIGLNLD
jgi:hypothetical protein